MAIPAAVLALPPSVTAQLAALAKPKFDAYFSFTAAAPGVPPRAVPDPHGQPWFIYPNQTLLPDLTFLWSVFADVYHIVGGPEPLAALVRADPVLKQDVHRIVEGTSPSDQDGSFWLYPRGAIPIAVATDPELPSLLRTIRNGFAHSHWLLANLSAEDYWQALGWDITGAPTQFNLGGRPPKNHLMYIADASMPWNSSRFWTMSNLRILVTPSHILRYHLHLFLNYILNGDRTDIFHR